MKKIKIKAEIEFNTCIYDVEELKNKTNEEIAKYVLKDIGDRLYNISDLYMCSFVEKMTNDDGQDFGLETENVKIINFSTEEILCKDFINSLKK